MVLLAVIYIAFIGLGVPDSLFGTAWPAIYREFNLPISAAGCVTLLISMGTVVSSLASTLLIRRMGTARVTAFSTAMTALAMLAFSFSRNLLFLCLSAIPLGLGAGAIDTALNHYVALHYKAVHMNFLHCFYGIGVSLSPWVMSMAIAGKGGWRGGYRIAFLMQLGISILTIVTLPVWKKEKDSAAETEEMPQTLSLGALCRVPALPLIWCVLIGSCALEYTCGAWGSTFLVDGMGLPVAEAARVVLFYYVGMALGRFLSGILSARMSSWHLIFTGEGILFAAVILMALPLPPWAAGAGLFLAGLGNGPIFPNLIHLTPENFGRDISQAVMGTQMAAAYLGIMLAPPVFGWLGQQFGIRLFPFYLAVLWLLLFSGACLAVRRLRQSKASGRPEWGGR